LYSVVPGEKKPVEDIFRDMIIYVQRQVEGEYALPNYFTGPDAFRVWADGIRNGKADRGGIAYNSRVWGECRSHAVDFLFEAKKKLGKHGDLFDNAILFYRQISDILNSISELYPFDLSYYGKRNELNVNSTKAERLLIKAGEIEEKALESLYTIFFEL
jgi:hypothetical protein